MSDKRTLKARPLVYTVDEVRRLLGLGKNQAYNAIRSGEIPSIRLGRLILVPRARFHQLVNGDAIPMPAESEPLAAEQPDIVPAGEMRRGGGAG